MDTVIDSWSVLIPPELRRFLEEGRGRLLIKGGPGVGKTCLSLEILNLLRSERKGIYVTTRLQAESLLRFHPHLAATVKAISIEDVPRLSEELEEEKPYLLPIVERSKAKRSLNYLIKLLRMVERPIVVFDSWQAFIDQHPPEFRHELLLETSSWAEESGSLVIYVSESIREEKLDYVADGVIFLYGKNVEGRRIRIMEIKKLRGIPIRKYRYLYTLDGGRFFYFKEWEFNVLEKEKRVKTPFKKDPSDRCISTGIVELDRAIGGWTKGSINIIEIGKGVGRGYFSLLVPMVQGNLNYGRSFMDIPSGGHSGYKLSENFLIGHVDREMWDRVLFLHSRKTPRVTDESFIIHVDTTDPDKVVEQILSLAEKLVEKSRDGVVLAFIGADTLELYVGPEKALELLNNLAVFARSTGMITFLSYKIGQKIPKIVLHLADKHLKFFKMHGVVLFYGVIPYTPVYAIYTDTSRGYPQSTIKMIL